MLQRRLSFFYFLFVSFYAFPLAFIPVLAQSRGFSAREIAYIGMASTLTSILGGPLIMHLAYHYFSGRRLVQLGLALTVVTFTSLSAIHSIYIFLLIWFFNQLFFRVITIVDAEAIAAAAKKKITFEHVRLWGSLGFVFISYLIGFCIDWLTIEWSIFLGSSLLALACYYSSKLGTFLPNQPKKSEITSSLPIKMKRQAWFNAIVLMLINLFCWTAQVPLMLYFSVYLKALNWNGSLISTAWSIGVLAEILLFWLCPRIINKNSDYSSLLILTCIFSMLRWLILALRHDTNLILLSQSLHAFTFGGLFLASMKLMHDIMPEHLRDRGQAYIQAVGLGLGCLAGQWYFGFQAEQLNSYQEIPQLYLQSAAFTFIALLLSLILNKMLLKTCYSNTEISQ